MCLVDVGTGDRYLSLTESLFTVDGWLLRWNRYAVKMQIPGQTKHLLMENKNPIC